jgi:hypothetical protein
MTRQKTPDGQNGACRPRPDLVEGRKRLSSAAYVVGELYTSRRGEDGEWIPEIRRSAIPVRTPSRCGHSGSVCAECAETWMSGWVLRFQRTAGGRRLRDELGGEKALAAMAERRTRAEGATARMEGTVAGVPVTVEVADAELVITVGRFGPAAAGRLDIDPHSVTATLRVAVAGENGNTARPGQRRYFNLYPDPAAGAGGPGQEAQ